MRFSITGAVRLRSAIIVSHIAPGFNAHNGKPTWNASYVDTFRNLLIKVGGRLGFLLPAGCSLDFAAAFLGARDAAVCTLP